jgi:hypothetical protein
VVQGKVVQDNVEEYDDTDLLIRYHRSSPILERIPVTIRIIPVQKILGRCDRNSE